MGRGAGEHTPYVPGDQLRLLGSKREPPLAIERLKPGRLLSRPRFRHGQRGVRDQRGTRCDAVHANRFRRLPCFLSPNEQKFRLRVVR